MNLALDVVEDLARKYNERSSVNHVDNWRDDPLMLAYSIEDGKMTVKVEVV